MMEKNEIFPFLFALEISSSLFIVNISGMLLFDCENVLLEKNFKYYDLFFRSSSRIKFSRTFPSSYRH